jgi:Cd(II)/Pb(II)-responsive transcriptional regulator
MKIGDLAQAARCSAETIRYYEKEGLLPPALRASNNYRLYTSAHLERLKLIRNCRTLHMSQEEIRSLLHALDQSRTDCEPVNQLIDEHIAHVDARMEELQALRATLLGLRERCTHGSDVDHCGIIEGLNAMEPSGAGTMAGNHLS